MLTAEIIFDYVWLHFVSVFPEARNLPVAYGAADPQARVAVPASALTFFEKKLPFPEEVFWLEWDEKKLPLFAPPAAAGVLHQTENQVTIGADIIGAAFYFLSGWQEYYSLVRDKFGRYPYRESLQFRHGFVMVPVVNYYFDILKTALEKGYGISLKNPEHRITTFLSHDVDRLESAWKAEGMKLLKRGKLLPLPRLGWQKLRGHDNWLNLKTVAQSVKKAGAVSTFFWLAQKGKFRGHPNADYDLSGPKYQRLVQFLETEGFENGIHGSFGSSEDPVQLKQEKAKLPVPVLGNRFHYLCFDPVNTPRVLTEAGIQYDCTLGFAEHFGFRNGYCFPFRLFDFSALKPYPFLELPLNLMDTTLCHPNYLHVPPEQLTQTVRPMLQEIRKFGGVFGLLWHNENFSALNTENGPEAFNGLMLELQQMQSTFRTGGQLWHQYSELLQEAGGKG